MIIKGPYGSFRDAIGNNTNMVIVTDGTFVYKVGHGFTIPDTGSSQPGFLGGDVVWIFQDDIPTLDRMQGDGYTHMHGVNDIGYDVHQV